MLVVMTSGPPPDDGRLLDGRYRLGALLGTGGVSEVYRAVDERLHRGVAIKIFRGDVADELQRHEEEMRTLAQLNHASLVTVFDAGTDEETRQPYIVMALVEGATLADQLRDGPLSPHRSAEVGAAVADALAYVHGQGLVHRDIKPANVLISNAGRVFLADFGIARLVDSAHVTQAGDVLGTPAFFSPEQVSGEPVGPPTDVYALGLVLLECLTGHREYDGTSLEVAMARLTRPPHVPAALPPVWRDLLLGMTAQDASARPSAPQVAARLRQIVGGETQTLALAPLAPVVEPATVAMPMATTVMPAATTSVMSAPPPAPPRKSRRGWVIALVLILLIAAVAAGAVVYENRNQSSSNCSAGAAGLSGVLKADMHSLNAAACGSGGVSVSAASQLQPDLTTVRQAAGGSSRKALRAAVATLKTDAATLTTTGGITSLRQSNIDDAADKLLTDFLTKHAPPSPPPSTPPPTSSAPVTSSPPAPTATVTVIVPPSTPPATTPPATTSATTTP
jgi:serine/threonine protein kinase